MSRLAAAVPVLSISALPVAAEAGLHDTHVEASGAAGGRSPHRTYRAIVHDAGCGRAAAASVPAGKGHVFGLHAFGTAPCGTDRVSADAQD